MSADAATAVFETSKYWPVAIGFFGLGTGNLVGGSEALFKFAPSTREVEKSMAPRSFWMSGFMQFITGLITVRCANGRMLKPGLPVQRGNGCAPPKHRFQL